MIKEFTEGGTTVSTPSLFAVNGVQSLVYVEAHTTQQKRPTRHLEQRDKGRGSGAGNYSAKCIQIYQSKNLENGSINAPYWKLGSQVNENGVKHTENNVISWLKQNNIWLWVQTSDLMMIEDKIW